MIKNLEDLDALDRLMTPPETSKYIYKHARHGGTIFFKYLQWYRDELVIRTFAYRFYKRKGVQWTEVERAVVGKEFARRKNLYKTNMGGYHAVFEENQRGCSTNYYGYQYYYFSPDDFNKWYTDKYAGMYSPVINLDLLKKIDKYKYCGYSGKQELKEYLEYYDADHTVEYFGKAGLRYQAMLGKRAKKDKAFAKFIVANAKKVNIYGYTVTWYAYQHKCEFKDAEDAVRLKRMADTFFRGLRSVDYKVDKVKIYEYAKLTIGRWNFERLYRDYWDACVGLGLDMRDTKNSMPFDFHQMHDVRIDEWSSKKAALDKKEAAAFNKKIKEASEKWNIEIKSKTYEVKLPQCKRDFIREGVALHHCVGRMGYDKKMADGKIVIMFVRLKEDPTKSFVTVEYDLEKSRVVQEFGDHNRRPDKNTLAFIERWEKKMREVQKSETKVV